MKRIGIDLGGSTVKGGVLEGDDILLTSTHRTRLANSREEILDAVNATIIDLLRVYPDIERIGIVSAGDIDHVNGVCVYSSNLHGWTGTNIKGAIESRFHIETYVDNDAIGALLGEAHRYPNLKNITMLTFGTGVGGASLIDGVVSRETKTRWGERSIDKNGISLPFGEVGAAEAYLSTRAIQRYAFEEYRFSLKTLQIFERIRRGERKAIAALGVYTKHLNDLLELIEKEISPELIILGGGLMNSKEVMEKGIRLEKGKYAFAHFGNEAGIVGASLLPINDFYKEKE